MNLTTLREWARRTTIVEDTSVTNAQIEELINQGYQELSVMYPWSWLETTGDFTVSASVRSYDLPDNFDYGITMVDTDSDRGVPYVAAKDFFEEVGQDSSTTGDGARMWTIFDDKVYFHPVPATQTTAAYTLYYYTQITELTAQDEPDFHKAFHWALVEYLKWKLYDREEYFAQSERAFITWTRYVNEMIVFYNSKVKWSSFIWGDGRKARKFNNLPILDI